MQSADFPVRRNVSFSRSRVGRRGRIQAVFQQRGHVALDGFELVQPQVRIGNGEHVAGPGLFVNEHALAVADDLFLHLEHAFAFEHDGEDVTGGRVTRIVLLNQLPQQRFGGVLVNRIGGRRRRFVNSLPMRDEPGAVARVSGTLLLRARLADVRAPQLRRLIEQQRVIDLPVGKRLAARLAGMGAGLNVPIVHEIGRHYRARSETRNPKACDLASAASPSWERRRLAGPSLRRISSQPADGTPALPGPAIGSVLKNLAENLQIPAACPDGATGFV